MLCPNCNFENQTGAVFCVSCGANIEQQPQNPWQPTPNFNNPGFTPMPFVPAPEIAAAESKAVSSLVMGIISIVTSFLIAGIILAPLAMSNATKARSVLDERNQNYWIALAGKITGIIGLVFSIIGTLYWVVIVAILGSVIGGGFYY